MKTIDLKDWITYCFAAIILSYGFFYTWHFHSDVNFATFELLAGVIIGLLKWLDLVDDKKQDAN